MGKLPFSKPGIPRANHDERAHKQCAGSVSSNHNGCSRASTREHKFHGPTRSDIVLSSRGDTHPPESWHPVSGGARGGDLLRSRASVRPLTARVTAHVAWHALQGQTGVSFRLRGPLALQRRTGRLGHVPPDHRRSKADEADDHHKRGAEPDEVLNAAPSNSALVGRGLYGGVRASLGQRHG